MFYHGIMLKLIATIDRFAEKVNSPKIEGLDEAYAFVTNFFDECDLLPNEVYYTLEEAKEQARALHKEGYYSDEEIRAMIRGSLNTPAACMAGEATKLIASLLQKHTENMSPLRKKLTEEALGKIHYGGIALATQIVDKKMSELSATAFLVRVMAHERRHSVQPLELYKDFVAAKGMGRGLKYDKNMAIVSVDEDAYYRRVEENDAERAAVKQLIQFVRHMREQIV